MDSSQREKSSSDTTAFESDTPRKAGGLMSWAASKAVDYGSRRRALRAYFLASEAPVIGIRDLLLADVLAHLLQLKTNCGHRAAAGPEMFTREIFLLSAQPGDGNGALPLQKTNHRGHRVFGRNRDTYVYMVWHQVSLRNLTLLLLRQRVEDRAQLAPDVAEDRFRRRLGTNTT